MDGLGVSYGGPSQLIAQVFCWLDVTWRSLSLMRTTQAMKWFVIYLVIACKFCYLMFVELLLTHGHIGFIAAMTGFWSHLIVVAATAISTMCRPELGWYFDVLVVPVCRLLVRTSMLRRVRANGHLGLFLMWVWSGLQLETEFLVPWRYLSTFFLVHFLIVRFTSVRICSLFGILSSPVLVQ